jgi:hypothetical protein
MIERKLLLAPIDSTVSSCATRADDRNSRDANGVGIIFIIPALVQWGQSLGVIPND